MHEKLKIAGLVTGITVKSSIQAIIIPILAGTYTSMNFILMATSLQFLLVFGGIYIFLIKKHGCMKPQRKRLIILSGVFTSLMALCMIYSANTSRTPVIIQAILAGMPVIPTVILRKKFLKTKDVVYNRILIGLSLFFMIGSIGVSTIPLYSDNKFKVSSILWIVVYMLGVICMSTYNMLQEKYIVETGDDSFYNKIIIIFYARVVECIILLSFSWVEYFIGFTDNPVNAFFNSTELFGESATASLLLEGFVIAYLISFVLGIELNAISSNYNMLIPTIANPLVMIFFTIFGSLNHGIHYPIWVVCTCIALSTIGMILWVKGENNNPGYTVIN